MKPPIRKKTEQIRQFILQSVEAHPDDVSARTCEQFKISRQAVNRHLAALMEGGLLTATGKTRSRTYSLQELEKLEFSVSLVGLKEDQVWHDHLMPLLKENCPDNVYKICNYGFTEMLNNAIDHSEGSTSNIHVSINAANIQLVVIDDGVGIFNKLMDHFGYADERQAMLELSKGKLTTDAANHTGQGIFITSRSMDDFMVLAGHIGYSFDGEEWLLDAHGNHPNGTVVAMVISRFTDRQLVQVFDRYASDDEEWDFTRTHISLELARYEGGNLVSRSQAKRIMARLDGFTEANLDFHGVDIIGQAFADEIFRVFQNQYPDFRLYPIHANQAIEKMIRRARTGLDPR